jgi:hypothetical protein
MSRRSASQIVLLATCVAGIAWSAQSLFAVPYVPSVCCTSFEDCSAGYRCCEPSLVLPPCSDDEAGTCQVSCIPSGNQQ